MKKTFNVPVSLLIVASEVVRAVIYSIPADWSSLHGILYAPKAMIASGEALASTKLVLGTSITQMIDRTRSGQVADVFGVVIEGRKPAEIEFGGGFNHCEVMPMDQCKRMAAHFIRLGYRGRLTFRWRDREDGDPVDFECEIWMPSARELDAPSFTVESNSQDRSGGGTILPILEIFERLKLPLVPDRVLVPAGS